MSGDERYPEHLCSDGELDWGSHDDCLNCNLDSDDTPREKP